MGSVRVQHDGAGLFQVPLAALQKLLALGSGPQPQPKQLLHLQDARRGHYFRQAWCPVAVWLGLFVTAIIALQRAF